MCDKNPGILLQYLLPFPKTHLQLKTPASKPTERTMAENWEWDLLNGWKGTRNHPDFLPRLLLVGTTTTTAQCNRGIGEGKNPFFDLPRFCVGKWRKKSPGPDRWRWWMAQNESCSQHSPANNENVISRTWSGRVPIKLCLPCSRERNLWNMWLGKWGNHPSPIGLLWSSIPTCRRTTPTDRPMRWLRSRKPVEIDWLSFALPPLAASWLDGHCVSYWPLPNLDRIEPSQPSN